MTAIGRAIHFAEDLDEALGEAIRMVCEETGWVLGDGWLFNEDHTRLVAGARAYCAEPRFQTFIDGTHAMSFAKGEGLPGHVWATGEPIWLSPIREDSPLRSHALATAVGLHAALGVPIRDTSNQVIAVIVFFLEYPRERDEQLVATVTAVSDQLSGAFERKHAADELANQRRFLQALVDNMRDGVVACDATGRITFMNRSAHAMLGRPEGQPRPGWYIERNQPSDPATGQLLLHDELPLARALRGDHFTAMEVMQRGPNGTQRYVSVSGAPLADETTRRTGAVIVLRDVTELREADRRLRAAQRLEALGHMTGGIAHDFNNIIQVIGGSLDLMLAEGTDERTASLAATARVAVERSAELARKLLSFSRSRELAPAWVDPCALLEGVVAVLRTAMGRAITVECDLDRTAPSLYVDAAELESAIVNLAANARDAMEEGGRLTLSVRPAGPETLRRAGLEGTGWVAIEVADTGPGILAAIRDQVFEPYFTTKAEGKGTGLGLSMVYGFVTQSGGQIVLDSTEGMGTTFTLLFPRAGEEGE